MRSVFLPCSVAFVFLYPFLFFTGSIDRRITVLKSKSRPNRAV